jgi:hypothetical protein
VRFDECDHLAARLGVGEQLAARVRTVGDQALHTLGARGGVGAAERSARREAEQGAALDSNVVEQLVEQRNVLLDRERDPDVAVRQPGAEPVIADDGVALGERRDESPVAVVLPENLLVADPPGGKDERRPVADRGVGDPSRRRGAEADLVVHAEEP